MKRYLLSFILLFSNLVSLASFEYDEYLEKIATKPNLSAKLFKNYNKPLSSELNLWLDSVDRSLNPSEMATYDANFFISLDSEGNISGIAIEELRETDLAKYKKFLANFSTYKFPSLPEGLEGLVFNFDARTLFLERPLRNQFISNFDAEDSVKKVPVIKMNDGNVNMTMLKPQHIDVPVMGEEIIFKTDEGNLLRTHVIDVDRNNFKVLAHQLITDDKDLYHLNSAFNVERPKEKSHNKLKAVLDSGFGTAILSGVSTAISSYGIVPGALAVMGMTGAAIEENEKKSSFDFTKGDTISLTGLKDL